MLVAFPLTKMTFLDMVTTSAAATVVWPVPWPPPELPAALVEEPDAVCVEVDDFAVLVDVFSDELAVTVTDPVLPEVEVDAALVLDEVLVEVLVPLVLLELPWDEDPLTVLTVTPLPLEALSPTLPSVRYQASPVHLP